MLTNRCWGLATPLCAVGLVLAACTSSDSSAPPIDSTITTTTETPERPETIRIGIAVNEAAPTAAFDSQIESILMTAAETLTVDTGISIDVRTVSIETPGQAQGSMLSLINDGVSVVITGCDDATVPAVVEAATTSELLAVTGCVALPRPDISRLEDGIDEQLFVDLSSLSDNARAIASHAADQGFRSLGVLTSNLLPDVERTCSDLATEVEAELFETGFTELVDAPSDAVADFGGELGENSVDAIVVCALPPTVGDLIAALRTAGFDQPVIVPWYGDTQIWPASTREVFVVTPASRYGDDPQARTSTLFETLMGEGEEPDSVDVVTADTLAILTDAAERVGSVGSLRLAEAIRDRNSAVDGEIMAMSGALHVGGENVVPVRRVYRVIEIDGGVASFLTEASALDS